MIPEGENIYVFTGTERVKNKFGVIRFTDCSGFVWQLNRRMINDSFGRGQAFCSKIEDRGYVDLNHWHRINLKEWAAKHGIAS